MCNECSGDVGHASRRSFLRLGLMGTGALAMGALATSAQAEDCGVFNAAMQQAITPDEAIARLMDGNARFMARKELACDLMEEAMITASKQTPFACVLGCMDSRAAPELVFNQQFGDIFVSRVAGNVATPEIIGSFEYGTKVAGAKAIMVLGHSHCGAIKGAIDKAVVGQNLTALLDEIEPIVATVGGEGERSSENHELVAAVAAANVRNAAEKLVSSSKVLASLVASGELKIVAAMYDIDTGKVHLLA